MPVPRMARPSTGAQRPMPRRSQVTASCASARRCWLVGVTAEPLAAPRPRCAGTVLVCRRPVRAPQPPGQVIEVPEPPQAARGTRIWAVTASPALVGVVLAIMLHLVHFLAFAVLGCLASSSPASASGSAPGGVPGISSTHIARGCAKSKPPSTMPWPPRSRGAETRSPIPRRLCTSRHRRRCGCGIVREAIRTCSASAWSHRTPVHAAGEVRARHGSGQDA